MKTTRVIFNNPKENLFYKLEEIGIISIEKKVKSYHWKNNELSKNLIWGNYSDFKLSPEKYQAKYFDGFWISATIDVTEQGLEILNKSGLNFEIIS